MAIAVAVPQSHEDEVAAGSGVIVPINTKVEFVGRDQGYLPMWWINQLTQVRQTYEGIERLADDMADKGMLHPMYVACLTTPERARDYMELVNLVFEADHTLSSLVSYPGSEWSHVIQIAGHRRQRAQVRLWNEGCTRCREEYGLEPPGTCYRRHSVLSSQGLVWAVLKEDIDPLDALDIQCAENISEHVPAHEQADSYERLFVVRSLKNPSLTITEYARKVGCGADTIRRARNFCRLPAAIREDVEEHRLSYGVALELGRMKERLNLTDEILASERERVILGSITAKDLRKYADKLIADAAAGVVGMFGLEALIDSERQHRRMVFSQQLVRDIHSRTAYLRKALPLLESGQMSPDGTYLDTSVRRIVTDNITTLEIVLQDLRQRLTVADVERAEAVIAEVRRSVAQIDATEIPMTDHNRATSVVR